MLKFFMIKNGLEQTRQKIKNFDRLYIYLLQDSYSVMFSINCEELRKNNMLHFQC